MSDSPVLVPVSTSTTLRETVEYVVESVLDAADDGQRPTVHFVYVHAPREFDPDVGAPSLDAADDLLDRVEVWAAEDAGDEDAVDVTTGHVGRDRYLFSPADVAASLLDAAREVGARRIVLDPEYDPGIGAPLLQPLEYELSHDPYVEIEEAPVRVQVRRFPLVRSVSPARTGALVAVAFLFYQVLAGGLSTFDLVTGAVTATIVAVSLSRVSFGNAPTLRHTPLRVLRGAIYVPYLLWEIVKANVAVAAVILNPWADVDPKTTRVEPAVYGALPVTSLANSITLTPGTLTVRVEGRELLVHTLLPGAREDLFDGALERAIRFVFYGRRAMRIEGLGERGAAEVVEPPVTTDRTAVRSDGGEVRSDGGGEVQSEDGVVRSGGDDSCAQADRRRSHTRGEDA